MSGGVNTIQYQSEPNFCYTQKNQEPVKNMNKILTVQFVETYYGQCIYYLSLVYKIKVF